MALTKGGTVKVVVTWKAGSPAGMVKVVVPRGRIWISIEGTWSKK